VWKNIWPIATGAGLSAFVLLNKRWSAWLSRLSIPPGDMVVPITALWRRLVNLWQRYLVQPLVDGSVFLCSWWRVTAAANVERPLARLSAVLENWGAVGMFVSLLTAALFVLLTF
jgi:hypothetical protein